MNIHFQWKWSLRDLPNYGSHIVILHPVYNKLYKGKFDSGSLKQTPEVMYILACEMRMKQTITFGSQIALDLPESGFYWDYISLNYNLPNV